MNPNVSISIAYYLTLSPRPDAFMDEAGTQKIQGIEPRGEGLGYTVDMGNDVKRSVNAGGWIYVDANALPAKEEPKEEAKSDE